MAPLAGFWSKDEILLDASQHNPLVYWLLTLAAFLTAFYIGRQVMLVFFGRPRTGAASHALENPPVMTVPLIILAVLAALGGWLNLPTIAGWAPPAAHALSNWLGHTLGAVPGGFKSRCILRHFLAACGPAVGEALPAAVDPEVLLGRPADDPF